MKYAEVTYTGRMRKNTYRPPGKTTPDGMTFTHGVPKSVESLEVAEWLESKSQFDVEWTARGRVARQLVGDEYDSIEEMWSDWGYRAKQQLAKSFGIKANQSEEDLESELENEVQELQSQMERL